MLRLLSPVRSSHDHRLNDTRTTHPPLGTHHALLIPLRKRGAAEGRSIPRLDGTQARFSRGTWANCKALPGYRAWREELPAVHELYPLGTQRHNKHVSGMLFNVQGWVRSRMRGSVLLSG